MRVLVADELSDDGVAELERDYDVDVRTGMGKQELLGRIGDYEAVVVRSSTTIDADVIAAATRLRVIGRAGIGLDNVDVPAATARGIIVCNAPQSNVISAAEHTVALLLALARDIPRAHRALTSGTWARSSYTGVELHGKTLGVVGLGRVGALVAQRCSAFGMHLVAYDPYVSPQRAARMGAQLVDSVPALCEVADIVTVHLPKTSDTVGIIGADELATLKPTALVVNTSRGGIVDEQALHQALVDGEIAGAALDVFEREPTTESPLFGLDNVVVTPHLGASTEEAQTKAGVMIAEAIHLALSGDFVPSAVNVQVAAGIPEPVKPFMPLAETLGRVFTALHAGSSVDLTIEYRGKLAGEETEALNLSVLRGILTDVSGEPVTFVNAPIIADERGIKTSILSTKETQDYVSLVRLSHGDVHVAGALVGANDRQRLVEVWGFEIEMEPSDHMVFFKYADRPGIVGLIGGKLGEAGVNIASMQVGRRSVGGEALIAMSVDSAIPDEVVRDIAEDIGASDARQINLED